MANRSDSLVFKNARQVQKPAVAPLVGRIIVDVFAVAALLYVIAFRVLKLF